MRTYPTTDRDQQEAAKLKAAPWMLDALRMNPDYCSWGPYEDWMCDTKAGWAAPVFEDTWTEFGWELNDLNEVVDFYFEVQRDSVPCEACGASGHNPATKRIADAFYDFEGTGNRWCDAITQDEVDALWAKHRLFQWKEKPTPAEVNKAVPHDGINRWILIETRARRLSVWGECAECGGDGHLFTEPAAHLGLVLWVLHPRKGASRGVEVKRIDRHQLPDAIAYLQRAAERNAQRFSRLRPEGTPGV
jgi:hypothetical protein